MAVTIQFKLNEKLFLRDPQETELGRKIIHDSIIIIDEIGFEQFTFKKLAERINSTEASVYRYFENKHRLLVYLLCWYWEWMKYRIEYNTNNVADPREKLRIALHTLAGSSKRDPAIDFVDEDILHRIVVAEGTKTYHTKEVDKINKEGFFLTYKALAKQLSSIISEISPGFPYPKALASTLLEMASNHLYYAQHLPSLTDIHFLADDFTSLEKLLDFFAFRLLNTDH